jgi:hypothetical protein
MKMFEIKKNPPTSDDPAGDVTPEEVVVVPDEISETPTPVDDVVEEVKPEKTAPKVDAIRKDDAENAVKPQRKSSKTKKKEPVKAKEDTPKPDVRMDVKHDKTTVAPNPKASASNVEATKKPTVAPNNWGGNGDMSALVKAIVESNKINSDMLAEMKSFTAAIVEMTKRPLEPKVVIMPADTTKVVTKTINRDSNNLISSVTETVEDVQNEKDNK